MKAAVGPYKQGELFPNVAIEPTISVRDGEEHVVQCSWCGLLVCASKKVELGNCPACTCSKWWAQELPVGPFHAKPVAAGVTG